MIKVKDANRSAAKWQERTSGATSAYIEGVQNPKQDWQQATAAASENYKAGIAKSNARDGFKKGVMGVDSSKQMNAAVSKGAPRFASGVAAGTPEYAQAIAPFLNVLANVNLPPRGPKGDPSNLARVGAVNAAQHAAKLSGIK